MLPRFDADTVWERIASGSLTLFMAVPTIYLKLISAWEAASPERQAVLSQVLRPAAADGVRLGGAAGLHAEPLEADQRPYLARALWHDGDRHGAVEPLGRRASARKRWHAAARRWKCDWWTSKGKRSAADAPGEIEVRGPSVFKEYWGKPEATQQSFRNGWFRTGDVAVLENGRYRILGRMNIDILKTGGHKVSALEVEEQLREHPAVAECAVVGVAGRRMG